MSARTKIGIIILIAIIAQSAMHYGLFMVFSPHEASTTGSEQASAKLHRSQQAIREQVRRLSSVCLDWSTRKDARELFADVREDTLRARVRVAANGSDRFDLMLVFDAEGELVFGAQLRGDRLIGIDSTKGARGLFEDPSPRLFRPRSVGGATEGVVRTRRGPMLVASRPIFAAASAESVYGVILMGRLADSALATALSQDMHVALSMSPIGSGDDSSDQNELARTLFQADKPVILHSDDGTETAYGVVRDIGGKPAILLRVLIPQPPTAANASTDLAMASTVAGGIMLLVFLLWVLKRTFIFPLASLVSQARKAGKHGRLSLSLRAGRDDEIGELAGEFNRALEFQRSVLDTAATAIFVVDADHRIPDVNEELCRVTGYSRQELIGTPCRILSGDRCSRDCASHELASKKAIFRRQCTARTKSGEELTVIKNYHKVCNDRGEVIGGIESFVDVTAEDSARRQAETATAAKSEFLASMSHEIRTPLNGVIGTTCLMQRTDMTAKQERYAEIIKSSAEGLLDLINDILDFSKIEAGKLELSNVDFDLANAFERTADLFTHLAGEKGVDLVTEISPDVPAALHGDDSRIRQILTNLIGNSLKFTESGRVKARAELVEHTGDSVIVRLAVSDTGIGIPEDSQDRLFKSFSQVDASTTRKYGGTGLGLAICKRLAEMMGGQIGFESTEGVGSTFWVTVSLTEAGAPVVVEPPQAAAGPKTRIGPADRNDRIVLLVEDNKINQELTAEVLSSAGYLHDIAATGVEAVDALMKKKYDLVLMDCQMPEMDGFEATLIIRQKEQLGMVMARSGARIPVLALTANALGGEQERCRQVGMDGYLAKPIVPDDLIAAIDDEIGLVGQEAGEGFEDEHVPAQANPPASSAIDMDELLKRCLGKQELVDRLFQMFVEKLPGDLAAIRQALADQDTEAVRQLAHGLKGASANMAAHDLSDATSELEQLAKDGSLDGAVDVLARVDAAAEACMATIEGLSRTN